MHVEVARVARKTQNSRAQKVGAKMEIRSDLSGRIKQVLKDEKRALLEKLIHDSGHQGLSLVSGLARGFDDR